MNIDVSLGLHLDANINIGASWGLDIGCQYEYLRELGIKLECQYEYWLPILDQSRAILTFLLGTNMFCQFWSN